MEEIDLKELLDFFKSKMGMFLIITASVCLLGCMYGLLIQKPLYKSDAKIILSSNESTITQTDISINNNLVDTYAEIVKSRRVLMKVINELKLNYTYEDLSGNISVTSVNDTEVIKITVIDKEPNQAKNIANVTAEYFIDEIVDIYNMNNVKILDEAILSDNPYNINVIKQACIYFALGLVLACGILFIIFYFDRTIKSVEQIENKIRIPILGSVQELNVKDGNKKEELVIQNKPKSNISEDIRTIRTNLQFTSADTESQVLLMASSVPGEGKSFISANLATAFAQAGESTLLIDSDLRLGRVHKIFGVSNSKGLSNLLVSQDTIDCGEFIKKTSIPNLYVIPRGNVPPNPSELLNSSNTKKVITFLRENFDRIIFDGVPINGLPDSLVMANIVDRVIVASALGYTKIDELGETKKALEKIDAKIAGVVVNRAQKAKRGKYSSYYSE